MKTVIQRVKSASVTVDGQLISSIGQGLLVLAAVSRDDTIKDVESMAAKVLKSKFWDDGSQDPPARWKCSVKDIGGEILCVSQFTLLATMKKGNKPDFHQSASGDKARSFYEAFYRRLGQLYDVDKVKNGVFAAMMDVALINDGPVTIELDTNPPRLPDLHTSQVAGSEKLPALPSEPRAGIERNASTSAQ
ncbi:D-tyrosyl-tRNA(Tyr) deacylase [Coniothyrium glycines]